MLSDIPTLLDDISAGRMVILMDDEDRENEGDLIIAAEKVHAGNHQFLCHRSLRFDLHADHTRAGTPTEPALDGAR